MRKTDVLHACFEAIGRADVDALVEHYTDDYVLELPFNYPDEPVRARSREEARSYLREAFEVLRFELEVTAHYDVPDQDLLVTEHVSRGEVLTTGKPYNNMYIALWWFRGDQVCRTREYPNPLIAAEAMRPD